MAELKVPFVDLRASHRAIAEETVAAALGVVERQSFILGEPVARFEATLAKLCGTAHAVGVGSGTDALVIALRALGVGPGDRVVTSAFSFVASADAIVQAGARPVFVDVDLDTFAIDPARAAEALEGARAIVPVHLFGRCADVDGWLSEARARRVAVLEDAAQAIGARSRGRPAGSIGDAGALSFFPTKNLGAWGDGGAIVTSDADVAARARRLRVHGAIGEYRHGEIGWNSRLDALQAAVLDVKARHLEDWTRARARVAARYREALAGLGERCVLPADVDAAAGDRHAYNQLVVRVPRRDALARALAEAGVETKVYYPVPLPEQPCFAPWRDARARFPAAEEAARTALALPIYPELPDRSIDHVAATMRAFFART